MVKITPTNNDPSWLVSFESNPEFPKGHVQIDIRHKSLDMTGIGHGSVMDVKMARSQAYKNGYLISSVDTRPVCARTET